MGCFYFLKSESANLKLITRAVVIVPCDRYQTHWTRKQQALKSLRKILKIEIYLSHENWKRDPIKM